MPRTCCVPGCRSRYKRNDEKVSMFSLRRDTERREKWKRAILRQGTGDFTFDSPHVRVCEKHFDESDIVRVDQWIIGGAVVTSQRDVLKLRPDAVPRIFDGLPAYLSSAKTIQTRLPRQQTRSKRRLEPSPDVETVEAAPTLCTSPSDTATADNNAANEGEHIDRLDARLLVACP